MSKKRTFHRRQLCPGEMRWTDIPARFGTGTVKGWTCSLCGKVLRVGVHSLQHTPEKEQES
jgi:rubredoxin